MTATDTRTKPAEVVMTESTGMFLRELVGTADYDGWAIEASRIIPEGLHVTAKHPDGRTASVTASEEQIFVAMAHFAIEIAQAERSPE